MQITLDIAGHTLQVLDDLAAKQGRKREALINQALSVFIAEQQRDEALTWKDGDSTTFLERLREEWRRD